MQFTLGDKGEVHLLDESVLPVNEKERRGEGKSSIGPKLKYGHTSHKSFCKMCVSILLTRFWVLLSPDGLLKYFYRTFSEVFSYVYLLYMS